MREMESFLNLARKKTTRHNKALTKQTNEIFATWKQHSKSTVVNIGNRISNLAQVSRVCEFVFR